MAGETFRRRGGPIDLEISEAHGGKPPLPDAGGNAAADADYFGNLKKFERHDNMAAEPTRKKGGNRD